MSIDELIAKLEELKQPDRELDAEIAVQLYGGEIEWLQANYTMDQYPVRVTRSSDHVTGYAKERIPEYTAKIDDALSLTMGHPVDIHYGPRGRGNEAIIHKRIISLDDQGRRVTTFKPFEAKAGRGGTLHWTPAAVQICIAALRMKKEAE